MEDFVNKKGVANYWDCCVCTLCFGQVTGVMRLLGTLRFHLRVPSLHGSHRDLTKMRIEIEIWGDFCEINDIYSAAAITVMNAKS